MVTVLLQAPTPGQNPRTPTVHAATKPVASVEPRAVIDGAKTPDLIPDDQAYHLVLMVASAADDAPEVEKERAKAVRAMILRFSGLPGDDVPEVAEVANHYRKTLTTLAAEAKRGNADAERLKSEHLGRVKAEAELRLPAATRKALADYVKAEKANMKIYGKPDPQVVALPKLLEPGERVMAAAACLNEAGSLAPYCSDNCSGARPCDKKCRRADESCTTCGDYGVCCCLGGGGGPTPTPTPTPPPGGGMVGQPSGATYRNVTVNDDLVMFGTAVTDSSASCSCHSSRAGATIRAPWGTISSSTGIGAAWVQATVQYQLSEAEFPGDVVFETDHYSFCPIQASVFIDLRLSNIIPVKPFISRLRYLASASDPEPHAYGSDDVYERDDCYGYCQPAGRIRKHGDNIGHLWMMISGLKVNLPYGDFCYGRARKSTVRPPCLQP